MKYQIRLLDRNLPGLVRELSLACWNAVDTLLPEVPGLTLYRNLYRGMRDVLRTHVTAFRYCGGAMSCEHSVRPAGTAPRVAHEAFPGERIRIYLMEPETSPEVLVEKLLQKSVRVVVGCFPGRRLPGMAPALRNQIRKVLKDRVFASESCGPSPLCHANEAYDPWEEAVRVHA